MTPVVSEKLFRFVSGTAIGPLWRIPEAGDPECPLHQDYVHLLATVPQHLVDEARNDPILEVHGPANSDRHVREWAAIRYLNEEISRRRLQMLLNPAQRPEPFSSAALLDLSPDRDGLIGLTHFVYDGSVLERKGHAFMMAPMAPSPNAPYWFLLQVMNHHLVDRVALRLDPLMHGPADIYPRMGYYMQVYGRPLDWERIGFLREAEHGRWWPDKDGEAWHYTDYVWDPRPDGIHFLCEEIPREGEHSSRASRYLHGIYDPEKRVFTHFDGALRIYSSDDLNIRSQLHVREAGKIAKRVKLFRVEGDVTRQCFSDLAACFFVWNGDVARYFQYGA